MSWLTKLMPARIRTQGGGKRGVPEGLWEKCDRCGTALYGPELEKNLRGLPEVQPPPEHRGPRAAGQLPGR